MDNYPLYYLGWTEKDKEKLGGLGTVHPDYLNVSIRFSQDDENVALESLWCYKTQFSKETVEEWTAAEKADTTNTLHFRQLTVPSSRREGF